MDVSLRAKYEREFVSMMFLFGKLSMQLSRQRIDFLVVVMAG
jgi:hypothetical protein